VTYDGHSGIDFEVASFREMDLGIPVLASADGIVEELNDKSSDHNTSCSSDLWNYVKLRHTNGFATIYGHLKKNSLMVKIGQQVIAGTPLGIVGSSGCSSFPHVHLETIDCQGVAFDAMQAQLFENPPTYSHDAPATLMETSIFQPVVKTVQSIQDPGPSDINLVSRGRQFSVAMTVSHLRPGDTIRIDFLNPAGEIAPFAYDQTITRYYARSHWWGNFYLDEGGTWTILFKINGQTQLERSINAVD
jgi:murein DD-endopeptidase MepM/ murein hydrolase activator NlpD